MEIHSLRLVPAGSRVFTGRFGFFVVDSLQLSNGRQPPNGEACESQIAAILHCLAPAHVFAVVHRGPHESGGRIDPVTAYLSLVQLISVFGRRLSVGDGRGYRTRT